MHDWEGCTTGTIGLPNPNRRSVVKTSGFLRPSIYRYTRSCHRRIGGWSISGLEPAGPPNMRGRVDDRRRMKPHDGAKENAPKYQAESNVCSCCPTLRSSEWRNYGRFVLRVVVRRAGTM